MEALKSQRKRNGNSLYSDSEALLSTRPMAGSRTLQRNENAFGGGKYSSFSQKMTQKQYTSASNKKKTRTRSPETDHDEVSSDDQLNSLSEASLKKPPSGRYHDPKTGKNHDFMPNHTPSKSKNLKALKFKKNNSQTSHEVQRAEPPSVIDLESRENTPIIGFEDLEQVAKKPLGSTWSQDTKGRSRVTPPLPHRTTRGPRDRALSPPKPKTFEVSKLYHSPPKPRPRPRSKVKDAMKSKATDLARKPSNALKARSQSSDSSSSDSIDIVPEGPKPFPMNFIPEPSSSNPSGRSRPTRPQPFPGLSPPRSSSASPPPARPTRSVKKTPKPPPQPFPMDLAAPASKNTSSRKGKGRQSMVLVSEEESEEEEAAPFPLSTQFFERIGSPTKGAGLLEARKKRYPTGSDSDELSPRKKSKADESLFNDDAFDDGSFFISATTDPKTLCPYCDSPLPSSPSPMLLGLLETMATKSIRDPRPANPLGRKAPFTMFIALCQRHRFESEILPDAERKGWPKVIDWKRLATRIEDLRPELQILINDTSDDGPRSQSPFWLEIMEAVKAKGSRAATGVKDQFLNFEKTQPGYYGELGSVIIHQTLYDLFPPASIDANLITPLGAEEFLQRVLIPEVALRLITEDKSIRGETGRKKALQILRESSAYGVAMFPADGSEYGQKAKKIREGITAGETIVMERARKRRKEIEEEDALEQAELEKKKAAGKPRPRPRALGKATSKSSVMDIVTKSDDEDEQRPPVACDEAMHYDTDPTEPTRDYHADESDAYSEVAVSLPPTRKSRSPSIAIVKSGEGKKGRGKPASIPRSSGRLKKRDRESSPPGKGTNTDEQPLGKAKAPSRTGRRRRGDMESGSDSSSVIEVDDAPFKTPKPKKPAKFREPPAERVFDDQPTPRPSHLAPSSSSRSIADMPPLMRAKLMKQQEQEDRARGAKIDLPSSSPPASPTWLRSMRAEYTSAPEFDWLLNDHSDSNASTPSSSRRH